MSYNLSETQITEWNEEGYLLIKDFLSEEEKQNMIQWSYDIRNLEDSPGKWMNYYEKVVNLEGNEERVLCRTENFTPFHEGIRNMILGERMMGMLSQIFGEEAYLFKEKINYKLPRGGGFPPHQDAPAFAQFGQPSHISVMIAVDPMIPENGCLEVVRGGHLEGQLPQEQDGTIALSYVNSHQWDYVRCEPGDVLIFGSYLPHRSGTNLTDKNRTAYYLTYNKAGHGDMRDKYYEEKRELFPPIYERVEGKDYSEGAKIYNLATPIENN